MDTSQLAWIVITLVLALGVVGLAILWGQTRAKLGSAEQRTAELLAERVRLEADVNAVTAERNELKIDLAAAGERDKQAQKVEAELLDKEDRIEQLTAELERVRLERTNLETQLTEREAALTKQLQAIKDAQSELPKAFAELSQAALQMNNQMFLDLAEQKLAAKEEEAKSDLQKRQQAIAELVKPLSQSIDKVDAQIRVFVEAFGEHKVMTTQLANSLKIPAHRGRWGESQLDRLFEMAGLTKGVHYTLQKTEPGDDSVGRLDALVSLPDERSMAVDAKMVWDEYDRACNESDEQRREQSYRAHAKAVRARLIDLAKRNYTDLPSKPLYVVMYLPVEGMFSMAVQYDENLLAFADEKGIYIASPTTMLALLRLCSLEWTHSKLAAGAEEIRDLGAELHKRVRSFTDHMSKLGRALDTSVDAYNHAVGSLERFVLPQSRRFSELGVTTTSIPELTEIQVRARHLHASTRAAEIDMEQVASTPLHETGGNDPSLDGPPRSD